MAIEAFAEVRKSLPDAELYLCGEGPLQSELVELASDLGVREAVTFLGQVPYEQMPAVYRGVDVLVLPSRAEGVPRTIMEALASGVSVVSSDLAQVRSAFGDAVMYAEDNRANNFCEKIQSEITTGKSKLTSSFKWNKTVTQTTAELDAITR